MEKYTLQEYANLLQNLRMMKEFYSNGEEEKNVGYLTYDSREVTEGTLFICKGAAFKAEYLDAAIEKGAIAYVSEVKYETKEDVPYFLVDDIRKAMPPLAEKCTVEETDDHRNRRNKRKIHFRLLYESNRG